MVYEVWGAYSYEDYKDILLEIFEHESDAEECAVDFASIDGRRAYVVKEE